MIKRYQNSSRPKSAMAKSAVACGLVVALGATPLFAQQENTQRRNNNNQAQQQQERQQQEGQRDWDRQVRRSTGSPQDMQAINQFIASKLILCNNSQIEAAGMIQDMTDSEAVAGFARKLVEDHQSLNVMLDPHKASYSAHPKLAKWNEDEAEETAAEDSTRKQAAKLAAGSQVTDVTNPDKTDSSTTQTDQLTDTAQRETQETSMRTTAPQPLQELYMIATEAANIQKQQCQQMLKQYEKGYERDMAFVGAQIAAHQMLHAELKAVENRTSGEIQQVARKGIQMVEGHLRMARQLSDNLEGLEENGNYKKTLDDRSSKSGQSSQSDKDKYGDKKQDDQNRDQRDDQ